MDKRLADIFTGTVDAAAGDPADGVAAAARAIGEMQTLLKETRPAHPEAAGKLDDQLGQTREMGTLIGRAAAAQAVGDHEAAQGFAQAIARLGEARQPREDCGRRAAGRATMALPFRAARH